MKMRTRSRIQVGTGWSVGRVEKFLHGSSFPTTFYGNKKSLANMRSWSGKTLYIHETGGVFRVDEGEKVMGEVKVGTG